MTQVLADKATKYDIHLNFTHLFVLHYTELQRMKEFFLSPLLPSLCLAILLFIALAFYSAGTSFKSLCCRFYPLQSLNYSRPRQHYSKCYYVEFPFCSVPSRFYT